MAETISRLLRTRGLLLATALALFAVNLAYRFPGDGTPDSDYQYAQAVGHHFTDWHPPVMAWAWGALRFIADGNAPMYTLQIALYWLGFSLLAFALRRQERLYSAWGALAICAFPPFLMLNIVIMKDILLAGTLLVAFALMLLWRGRDVRLPAGAVIVAGLLLVFGTLLRVNAVFAAPPLLAYLAFPSLCQRPVRLAIASIVAAGILIPVVGLVNHKLLQAEDAHAIRSLQLHDLAGIAHFSNDTSVFGAQAGKVQDCYTPLMWDSMGPFNRCADHFRHFALSQATAPPFISFDEAILRPANPDLTSLWVQAITTHPLAYGEHRLAQFNSEMYFLVPDHHADLAVQASVTQGVPIVAPPRSLSRTALDLIRNNVFTAPIFLMTAGTALWLLLATRPALFDARRRAAAIVLTTSALLYGAAYAVIGVATDPRYQFWSLLAICAAFLIALPDLRGWWQAGRRGRWIYAGVLACVVTVTFAARLVLGDALAR